ncbi:unnamed protein product, partial [Schistosoma intercalatum]
RIDDTWRRGVGERDGQTGCSCGSGETCEETTNHSRTTGRIDDTWRRGVGERDGQTGCSCGSGETCEETTNHSRTTG